MLGSSRRGHLSTSSVFSATPFRNAITSYIRRVSFFFLSMSPPPHLPPLRVHPVLSEASAKLRSGIKWRSPSYNVEGRTNLLVRKARSQAAGTMRTSRPRFLASTPDIFHARICSSSTYGFGRMEPEVGVLRWLGRAMQSRQPSDNLLITVDLLCRCG